MLDNKNIQDTCRKMTVSYLRLTWFGLQSMASFVQPFIPTVLPKNNREANKDNKLEDRLP